MVKKPTLSYLSLNRYRVMTNRRTAKQTELR